MSFRLKEFTDLVGIDKETSTYNTPVFQKDLGGDILGEANNDGTIFIDKSLSGKEKIEAVEHEKVHLEKAEALNGKMKPITQKKILNNGIQSKTDNIKSMFSLQVRRKLN